MKSQQQLVVEMNIAFDNHAGHQSFFLPANRSNRSEEQYIASWSQVEKQCKNIFDEINELDEAIKENNVDEIRDANCDIRVFCYGAVHFMGFDMESFRRDTKNNLALSLLSIKIDSAVENFKSTHTLLMKAISERDVGSTSLFLSSILIQSENAAKTIGQNLNDDMRTVVSAVMTRFIKNDEDKAATISLHAKKGVTDVFFTGEYPSMIMKSASDQPDAPKGKFMKSASYSQPIFPPLGN
jgi:hypothetical protein